MKFTGVFDPKVNVAFSCFDLGSLFCSASGLQGAADARLRCLRCKLVPQKDRRLFQITRPAPRADAIMAQSLEHDWSDIMRSSAFVWRCSDVAKHPYIGIDPQYGTVMFEVSFTSILSCCFSRPHQNPGLPDLVRKTHLVSTNVKLLLLITVIRISNGG